MDYTQGFLFPPPPHTRVALTLGLRCAFREKKDQSTKNKKACVFERRGELLDDRVPLQGYLESVKATLPGLSSARGTEPGDYRVPLGRLAEKCSVWEEVAPCHCASLGEQHCGWISMATHLLCWAHFVLTQMGTNRCAGQVGRRVPLSPFILLFQRNQKPCL